VAKDKFNDFVHLPFRAQDAFGWKTVGAPREGSLCEQAILP
jgi:hypothetical protein